MGVRRLMEFLGNVVPFVSDMPVVHNTRGVPVPPDANGPTSLYFFKTAVEPHIGGVQYFKVMSGKVHEGDDLTNADRGSKGVWHSFLFVRELIVFRCRNW